MLALLGCNSVIYEDMSDCPQGVHLQLYSKTPCDVYPSFPEDITDASVFVFDEGGLLVYQFDEKDIKLGADTYIEQLFYRPDGKGYTFVVWSGLEGNMKASPFTVNKTRKNELIMALTQERVKPGEGPTHVYVGVSEPIYFSNRDNQGTIFDLVNVNMKPVTQNIRVTINGLPNTSRYEMEISANNGKYDAFGNSLENSEVLYQSRASVVNNQLQSLFHVMRLNYDTDAEFTLYEVMNNGSRKQIYKYDLIKLIEAIYKDGGYERLNLDCLQDIDIELTLRQSDLYTYGIIQLRINNWTVVYNSIILGE